MSDGAQTLRPEQFQEMMTQVTGHCPCHRTYRLTPRTAIRIAA